MTTGRIIRSETAPLKLPLLGRIKVGMKMEKKNKDGKMIEYPTSLDHFVSVGKYEAKFREVYGDAPTKIELIFFSPNVADVCSEAYVVRDKAGRLVAEGDGETWRCWSESRQDYVFGETTLEEVEKKYEQKAKVTLTLRFILPRIPSVYGIWQFSTGGAKSTIPALRDTFDKVLEAAGPLIVNVPFDLHVEKVKGNRPGETRIFPVVSLIPNMSQESLDLVAKFAEEGMKIRGTLTEARLKALAATVEVEEEERPALPAAREPITVFPNPEKTLENPEKEPPTADPEIQKIHDLFPDAEIQK